MKRLASLLLTASYAFAQAPAQVDQIFAAWNRPNSPGCAVGVWRNGKPELMRGYGMANLEHSVPIGPQTSFYLASTSKEFTAAAVLLLAEGGALKLDEPVRKYLPNMPEAMQPVTIRHLLEHTSGIRDYVGLWTLSMASDDVPVDAASVLRMIARQKEINFQPGSQFLYSNSNYVLLAEVVKAIAKSLPAFARDGIFAPLGMRNTLYLSDRFAVVPKRATGYALAGDRYRVSTATHDVLGDGGVFSTLEDSLRWIQAMENPQGPWVKVFSAMQTRAKFSGGGEAEYGLGLMIKKHRGLDVWDHVGGLNGYRSDILYLPSEKLGVVCLCNAAEASTGRLARQVADVYLGARKDLPRPKLSAADLDRKTGTFRDRESGDFMILAQDNGQLVGQFQGFNLTLAPETPMRFRTVDSPVDLELEFKNAGERDEPSFLRVESEIHKPLLVDRIEPSSRPEDMSQFEGEYLADEVPSRARIVYLPDAGGLNIYQGETKLGNLVFVSGDKFTVKVLNLEFVRDAAGKVSGFRLNTGRVRRLLFGKLAVQP